MSRQRFDKKKIKSNCCEESSFDKYCNKISVTNIEDKSNEEEECNEVNEGILCSANFEELKNSMLDICDKGLWDGNLRIGPNQEGIKYILMNCLTEYECRIRHEIDLFNPQINSEQIMEDFNTFKINISKIVNAIDTLDQILFPEEEHEHE